MQPDIILLGGTIHTIDPARPHVTALALAGDQIINDILSYTTARHGIQLAKKREATQRFLMRRLKGHGFLKP